MKALLKRITDWHHWPFYLFYFPISYAWVVYYIKSRSLWYFTASNPTLAFGGFEGEGKSKMYQQLPAHLCPSTIIVKPSIPFAEVINLMAKTNIHYPFIVKPDIGMKGILFRKIDGEGQLKEYHGRMPVEYLIQEYVDMPYEVSVFYCRMPHAKKGAITAMIQKNLFEVEGDGSSTILELARMRATKESLTDLKKQHGKKLDRILQKGEKYQLSHIGNLVNGAQFENLTHQVDDQLIAVFDDISFQNQFYYGRYDIKCSSVEDLKSGKGFYILEFNGAGSVPNHIYTRTFTLWQAYKDILFHWKMMFDISRYNHKQGHRYWSFQKGRTFLKNSKQHFDVLKKLDKELVLNKSLTV